VADDGRSWSRNVGDIDGGAEVKVVPELKSSRQPYRKTNVRSLEIRHQCQLHSASSNHSQVFAHESFPISSSASLKLA
jgi:hypothetical protein